jgi:hypothetical protein
MTGLTDNTCPAVRGKHAIRNIVPNPQLRDGRTQRLPSFTITPLPPSETVFPGGIAAFALELRSTTGFNGNVTLSCSGGPSGSYCLSFPQTVRLINGKALAVSGIVFPQKTPPGTYTVTFTGVSGSLTNTAKATFTVKTRH